MGIVYKARDPLIDRIVALKTVALDLSSEESEAFEQRFYREAKSAGRLNHPNIVTIHDVGKSGDVAYIAMEFLQGRSLRDILDSGLVIPAERIAEIVAQVADGLAFAHDNGVVHRDIKPANIMVLDTGRVKIMDFGIARLPVGSHTVAGNVFGSPKYMAPERVAGATDGWTLRHLFARRGALRDADGIPAVFRRRSRIPARPGHPPEPGTTTQPQQDHSVCVRSHRRHVDGEASGRPIPRCPGDGVSGAKFPRSASTCDRTGRITAAGARLAPRLGRAVESYPVVRVVASPKDNVPEIAAAGRSAFEQRRRFVVYGGTGALLALLASAALLSQHASNAPPPANREPAGDAPDGTLADGTPEIRDQRGEGVEFAAPAPVLAASTPPAPVISQPPAASPPMARLALAVTPWGEVYVDGKRKGVAPPLTEIRVAPGKHSIEIRNTTFPTYAQSVDLAANGSLKIRHKFQ
jgi:serine/threonine-protein kinase